MLRGGHAYGQWPFLLYLQRGPESPIVVKIEEVSFQYNNITITVHKMELEILALVQIITQDRK